MIRLDQPWPDVPELAAVYDVECAGRWDHDFYLDLADRLGAATVVDIGCGTGVFCVDLARRGHRSVGTDPADAVLDIARRREGGDLVEWVHGGPEDLESGSADLIVMMGHVAQYFLSDTDWDDVLRACHRALRPGGHLTFETRMPTIDWATRWTRDASVGVLPHPDGGEFTSWVEMVECRPAGDGIVDTHEGHTILPDGRHLVARETLRFRSEREIRETLAAAGFEIAETWGDWDRTPLSPDSEELIVLARRG